MLKTLIFAIFIATASACGGPPRVGSPRLETTWVVRSPDKTTPRMLAIIAGSQGEETVATVYALCSWLRKTPDVQEHYAAAYVVATKDDPLAALAANLKTVLDRSPAPAAADGSPEARAYRQLKTLLPKTDALSKTRPELTRCFVRDDAQAAELDAVVISYAHMTEGTAGASYLLLHEHTSSRGFVPFGSSDIDDNSRRLAAVAIAREDEVVDLSVDASVSGWNRCEPAPPSSGPPAAICIYQPGEAVLHLDLRSSGYVGRDRVELSPVNEWTVLRDRGDAAHDLVATPIARGDRTLDLQVHFKRAGTYELGLILKAAGVARRISLPAIEVRTAAMILPGAPRRPGVLDDPRAIAFRVTCRARVYGSCDTMRDALRDSLVHELKARKVLAASTVTTAFDAIRVVLSAVESPFIHDDRSHKRWAIELARATSDDELAEAIQAGVDRDVRGWCERLSASVARAVTGFSGAEPFGDGRATWIARCSDLVTAQLHNATTVDRPAFTIYARGGATIFAELQQRGQVDLDLGLDNDSAEASAIAVSEGAAFDGGEETAMIVARLPDGRSRPISLTVKQDRSMSLAVVDARIGFAWLRDPARDALRHVAATSAAVALRVPFELGRLGLEATQAWRAPAGAETRDLSAVLAFHPQCYFSHHSHQREPHWFTRSWIFGDCRPRSALEVEVGLSFGDLSPWIGARLHVHIPLLPDAFTLETGVRSGSGLASGASLGFGLAL